jgi:hypothetical protein
MPTSPYGHIHCLVNFLSLIRPSSILDIGLGNGKVGWVARDFLDVMLGERYRREDWQVQIDGIEVFEDYIQDHQRSIYDQIYIGDAFDVIDSLGMYDLIVMADVLEHFEKEKAWQFFDKCITHSNCHIIICIPLSEGWKQPAIYGNPHERHLSFWDPAEFEPFVHAWEYFTYSPGRYGAYLIKKENYIDFRVEALLT